MKVILTGGAGFIGSCLLGKLNQEGISDILVVDEPGNSQKDRNLVGKNFRDYIEKDEFLKLIVDKEIDKGVDTLIHFGACTSTVLDDEKYFMENNYRYSKELANWALENKVNFLYASSAATYGDGEKGFSDKDEFTLELKPLNIYARSKHLFDLWLINNNLSNRVTGFKFFNVYGPNEYHKGEMRSVIAKSYDKIIKEGKIRLFKSYRKDYCDGGQKRDFIYVKDAVEIVYYFVENFQKHGIFNLGTGRARTWSELARAIFSALDMSPVIEYIDMPEDLRQRYQYYTQANLTKLRQAGCRHKFFDFSRSIKDYLWFLKNHAYL
jgi:ADP-L-glycero-D-manno-heptose 6-epimerase